MGNELRTVVAADVPWDAAHREELRERIDHVLAGDATIDLQGEAFTGLLIDDGQPLQLAAAHRPVVDEVPTPDVVRAFGPTLVAAVCARPYSSLFPLLEGLGLESLTDLPPFNGTASRERIWGWSKPREATNATRKEGTG